MSGTYNGSSLNRAASELYEYIIYPHYGESGFKNSKMARRINPFKDSIISELIYDVFCVIDSYDYFIAGDIDEETYRDDVKYFKNKWLKKGIDKAKIKEIVDDEIEATKEKLYRDFEIEFGPEGENKAL